jgi:hypothetical protein
MKSSWILPVPVLAVVAGFLVIPYGSPVLGYGYVAIPVLAALAAAAYFLPKKGLGRAVVFGVTALCCLIAYFLMIVVSFRDDIVGPRLQGVVTEVARSSNHGYPLVRIRNEDHSVVRLEGVSERFFESVKPNDTVEKAPGSTLARVNGNAVAVVDTSWVDMMRIPNR